MATQRRGILRSPVGGKLHPRWVTPESPRRRDHTGRCEHFSLARTTLTGTPSAVSSRWPSTSHRRSHGPASNGGCCTSYWRGSPALHWAGVGGLDHTRLTPVRWEMLPHLCELSAARQIPVAMHLAESRGELEFLRTGSGPLRRDLLQALGAWDAAAVPRGRSPRDYLEVLSTSHRGH